MVDSATLEQVMREQDVVARLTDSQIELIVRVALGKTNAQIAEDLHLREQTIKNRVNKLMKKLHATNRVHIATFACYGYPPTETQIRGRWRNLDREAAST